MYLFYRPLNNCIKTRAKQDLPLNISSLLADLRKYYVLHSLQVKSNPTK